MLLPELLNVSYCTGLQGDRVNIGTYNPDTHSDIVVPLGSSTEQTTLFITNLNDLHVPEVAPPHYSPSAPQLFQ